jgi:hypothetical protein
MPRLEVLAGRVRRDNGNPVPKLSLLAAHCPWRQTRRSGAQTSKGHNRHRDQVDIIGQGSERGSTKMDGMWQRCLRLPNYSILLVEDMRMMLDSDIPKVTTSIE